MKNRLVHTNSNYRIQIMELGLSDFVWLSGPLESSS